LRSSTSRQNESISAEQKEISLPITASLLDLMENPRRIEELRGEIERQERPTAKALEPFAEHDRRSTAIGFLYRLDRFFPMDLLG
jgi:hypothetical protein